MAPPVGLEPTVRLRALPSLALASDNAPCCRLYASRPLCGFALQNPAQARRFIGVNNKKRTSFRCPSFCGSPSWTRTNDPAVNSRMLYRLSYRGMKSSNDLIFRAVARKVPSAQMSLTSVFGMGTGGASSPSSLLWYIYGISPGYISLDSVCLFFPAT